MEGDALPGGAGLIGGRCPARMGWPDWREMPCHEGGGPDWREMPCHEGGDLIGGRCPAMRGGTGLEGDALP